MDIFYEKLFVESKSVKKKLEIVLESGSYIRLVPRSFACSRLRLWKI